MREEILNIVYDSIRFLNKTELKDLDEDTPLYAFEGTLSSIELVMLLADIETSIYEKFNKKIVIADKRAMSRTNSPFKDVKNLTDYLEIKLKR